MPASGSPKSPTISRKPAPLGSQRKLSQEPPATFNASQATQFRAGSQSPSRHQNYSSSPNPEIGRGLPSQIDRHEDEEQELEPVGQEVNQEEDEEIQVPSTNPVDGALTTSASVPCTISPSSGTRTLLPSERDTSPGETLEENNVDQDLEEFDMIDFQARYYAELSDIVKDEAELIAGFDRFSETFALWAQSASQRDTDRASKRLKTRETYLVFAEDKLEAKKAHYEQVVKAFQTAMALLNH